MLAHLKQDKQSNNKVSLSILFSNRRNVLQWVSWQQAIVCQLTFYCCIDNSVFIITLHHQTLVFSCNIPQSIIFMIFSKHLSSASFCSPYLWCCRVSLNTIMCSNGYIENLLPNLHKIGNNVRVAKLESLKPFNQWLGKK